MGNKVLPELGSDVMQQIYLTAIKRYRRCVFRWLRRYQSTRRKYIG